VVKGSAKAGPYAPRRRAIARGRATTVSASPLVRVGSDNTRPQLVPGGAFLHRASANAEQEERKKRKSAHNANDSRNVAGQPMLAPRASGTRVRTSPSLLRYTGERGHPSRVGHGTNHGHCFSAGYNDTCGADRLRIGSIGPRGLLGGGENASARPGALGATVIRSSGGVRS
jgi:hypothetical protein